MAVRAGKAAHILTNTVNSFELVVHNLLDLNFCVKFSVHAVKLWKIGAQPLLNFPEFLKSAWPQKVFS